MRRNCNWIRERLGALRDGELPAGESVEVAVHLAGCTSCHAERMELERADALLRDADPAAGLDAETESRSLARVLDRIAEEPEPSWARSISLPLAPESHLSRSRSWLRSAWGTRVQWASGIAVATVAVLLALRMGGPDPKLLERSTATDSPAKPPGTDFAAPVETATPDPGIRKDGAPEASSPGAATQVLPESEPAKGGSGAADARRQTRDASAPDVVHAPGASPRSGPVDDKGTGPKDQALPPDVVPAKKAAPPSAESPEALLDARAREEAAPPRAGGVRAAEPEAGAMRTDEPHRFAPPAGPPLPPPREAPPLRETPPPSTPRERARAESASRRDKESDTPHSRGGRSMEMQNYYVEPEAKSGAAAQEAALDSVLMSPEELREGLFRAEAALESDAGSPAERAEQWRRIGDLWEFLGRTDNGPMAHGRAVRAYDRAISLDPDVTIDSARLARARAALATPPPPREKEQPVEKGPSPRREPPREKRPPPEKGSPSERGERPGPKPGIPRPPGR